MTDNFNDVLEELAACDGACLYWQTDKRRFKPALDAGAIKQDGELLVHPYAIMVEQGMAYRMEDIADLCKVYADWNQANGLNLGSADEHWFDEDLTEEQRAWVREFSSRWDAAAARERIEG
jgi:hypothetical protein